jgi:hypothetical protein
MSSHAHCPAPGHPQSSQQVVLHRISSRDKSVKFTEVIACTKHSAIFLIILFAFILLKVRYVLQKSAGFITMEVPQQTDTIMIPSECR